MECLTGRSVRLEVTPAGDVLIAESAAEIAAPRAGAPAPVQQALVYSAILGSDLGPNITIIGSLATILWLVILRRKGMEVSPMDYFKIGIVVTPAMLAAGALAIWVAAVM